MVAIPETNNGIQATPETVEYYQKCIGNLLYLATVEDLARILVIYTFCFVRVDDFVFSMTNVFNNLLQGTHQLFNGSWSSSGMSSTAQRPQ